MTTIVIDKLILTTPLRSNKPVSGALADAHQRLADLAAAVRR